MQIYSVLLAGSRPVSCPSHPLFPPSRCAHARPSAASASSVHHTTPLFIQNYIRLHGARRREARQCVCRATSATDSGKDMILFSSRITSSLFPHYQGEVVLQPCTRTCVPCPPSLIKLARKTNIFPRRGESRETQLGRIKYQNLCLPNFLSLAFTTFVSFASFDP